MAESAAKESLRRPRSSQIDAANSNSTTQPQDPGDPVMSGASDSSGGSVWSAWGNNGDPDALDTMHRSGHAAQRRLEKSKAPDITWQGKLLYKYNGKQYRLRYVVLEANWLKLYQVDDKMMPIYTELVKELVLETGTMTVTPSKYKFVLILDGSKDQHAFKAEGETSLDSWNVGIAKVLSPPTAASDGGTGLPPIKKKFFSIAKIRHGSYGKKDATPQPSATDGRPAAADEAMAEDSHTRKQVAVTATAVFSALEQVIASATAVTATTDAGPDESSAVGPATDAFANADGDAGAPFARPPDLFALSTLLLSDVCSTCLLVRTITGMGTVDMKAYEKSLHQELAKLVFNVDTLTTRDSSVRADAPARRKSIATAGHLTRQTLQALLKAAEVPVTGQPPTFDPGAPLMRPPKPPRPPRQSPAPAVPESDAQNRGSSLLTKSEQEPLSVQPVTIWPLRRAEPMPQVDLVGSLASRKRAMTMMPKLTSSAGNQFQTTINLGLRGVISEVPASPNAQAQWRRMSISSALKLLADEDDPRSTDSPGSDTGTIRASSVCSDADEVGGLGSALTLTISDDSQLSRSTSDSPEKIQSPETPQADAAVGAVPDDEGKVKADYEVPSPYTSGGNGYSQEDRRDSAMSEMSFADAPADVPRRSITRQMSIVSLGQTTALKMREEELEGEKTLLVVSGSCAELVAHLLSDQNEDPDYLATFLHCYEIVMEPDQLLDQLLLHHASFMTLHQNGDASISQSEVFRAHQRACSVLVQVIHRSWATIDDALLLRIDQVVLDLIASGRAEAAQKIREEVRAQGETGIERAAPDGASPDIGAPLASLRVSMNQVSILDCSAMALAKTLTALDHDLFTQIEQAEVMIWRKKQSRQTSPNVYNMIDHFNRVSLWAATQILMQLTLPERAKAYQKLVETCKCLRKLHNFNTLMAILAAFNSSPVHRLKHTQDAVGAKWRTVLQRLQTLMSHEDAYATLRAALRTCRRPAIPYLGMYLSDITLVHHGNADFANADIIAQSNGELAEAVTPIVNFSKLRMLYGICRTIKLFQGDDYAGAAEIDSEVRDFLADFEHQNATQQFEISLHLEPRGTEVEDIA